MAAASETMSRAAWPAERVFFWWMTVAMATVVLVGFSRSFFLHPFFPDRHVPPETFFMIHGTVYAAWFALLVTQASLVTTGRLKIHRQLGVFGACLAVAMVILGVRAGLIGAHRASGFVDVEVPPLVFLSVPLIEMLVFAVLVTLAIVKRGDPQSHKRLMLIASAGLLSAAFARWPIVGAGGPLAFFGMTDLFVLALLIWDRKSQGRIHPVTKWAGGASVLSQPLRLALAATPVWMAFAHWAVSLVD